MDSTPPGTILALTPVTTSGPRGSTSLGDAEERNGLRTKNATTQDTAKTENLFAGERHNLTLAAVNVE
jgi:hypothetical protein